MLFVRRIVPYALLPLSIIACCLASAPWLRAFPSSVMSVPLFGAALLSVLAPLIVVGVGVRRLWLTALIDLVLLVFYELLVTLREPIGFPHLYTGLVHGPSQILSFALPLVSPRTLLVAPVALCWVAGAIVGECLARGWHSVLPYLTLLVTFGLAYAGTARAVTDSADGRRYDTILAGALLLTLLLLRAAQAWVAQDESAETTQPDGLLPLRGLAIGTALSVVIAVAASAIVQSSSFDSHATTLNRVPPLDQSQPLTPVAFVAGLRPSNPKSDGTVLFRVATNRPASDYISLATVDFYDGDGWSFSRTFRPSGGVVPADTDPALRPHTAPVTQEFTIGKGALTTVPWMPYLSRVQKVTGTAVNIDADSGMIVPAHGLQAGDSYTVQSAVPSKTFDQLGKTAQLEAGSPIDTTLANGLATPLSTLILSLSTETGVSSDQVIPFLQAVAKDFRTRDALAGAPASATPSASTTSGHRFVQPPARPTTHSTARKTPTHRATPTARPTPSPTPTPSSAPHTGGTSFADVLASIRGAHSATPEQYATLMALIARKLNVPARVVTGFRIPAGQHGTTHAVTTADAWTWVEIPVSGQGWVVLDPSPGTYSGQQPRQSAAPQPSPTPTPSSTPNALLTQSNQGGHAVAPKSKVPHSKGLPAWTIALIVVIAIVVLIALLIGLLLFRKAMRVRRRRHVGDPRRRLLGAWQESLDVLTEAGLPDLTNLTSAEVVASTADRFGGEPAVQARFIGDAANIAIFSPTSLVGPADADAAWRAQAAMSKAVRRRLGWRDRFNARLRYHRTHRTAMLVGPASWAAAARERSAASRARGRRRANGRGKRRR